jgi:hypothetical protein
MGWCHALGFFDRSPPQHTVIRAARESGAA